MMGSQMETWRNRAQVTEAQLEKLQAKIRSLQEALTSAANGLEAVAERTWDKRHHEECRRACDEASDMANGLCEEARAVLLAQAPAEARS